MSEQENIKLNIGGMTCVRCQEKIESGLLATEGVTAAHVSFADGSAEVTFDREVMTERKIAEVIESLGYCIVEEKGKSDVWKLLCPFLLFAAIAALFVPLQYFGLLNYLVPDKLADSSMGYGMLFVIGLITSVHCVAMCGGINLSQSLKKGEADGGEKKGARAFLPALSYNAGRVLSYTALGFVFGLVGYMLGGGSSIGISGILQGVLKIAAGVLMIVMGVNMLNLIPALRKLCAVLRCSARKSGGKKSTSVRPFIVGILNGIMPCGPLQSMWVVALATCNPFRGALAMLLFALGTVPLMLGLGAFVTGLGQRFSRAVTTVGSLLVVVLGLAMLAQGGSLTGAAFLSPFILASVVLALIFAGMICSLPVGRRSVRFLLRGAACCIAAVVVVCSCYLYSLRSSDRSYDYSVAGEGVQTVTSTLQSGSYPDISVVVGLPVVWTIQASSGSINGCNYKVLIPEYGIEYEFSAGENIIEFTPANSGTFDYSCWMGMIYGVIQVTE